MIKRLFRKRQNTVTFGGQTYEVQPLSMENSLSLMLLLSPYIALLEEKWPEFQAALQDTGGMRGGMLFAFFSHDQRRHDDAARRYDQSGCLASRLRFQGTRPNRNRRGISQGAIRP